MEPKVQGNTPSVVYSGIKNIVKTTSGKETDCLTYGTLQSNSLIFDFDILETVGVCGPKGTTESRRCWSGSERQTDVPRYHSEERCLALRLCGWINRGADTDVETFLRSLEQDHEWERAAAVALFNLDIRRAIQILNKGATADKGGTFGGREGESKCVWCNNGYFRWETLMLESFN